MGTDTVREAGVHANGHTNGTHPDERQRKLAELRRRMAAVPSRGESAAGRRPAPPERRETLPVPPALAGLLPGGGLAKGTVVSYAGARSLLTGLLAVATAQGRHAAVAGLPGFGLLAAAEMGADLRRLAVIPEPGPDPVEIAAVLLDGIDLVVLGLRGGSVAPSRARVIAARARAKGAVLVVTDGHWPDTTLRMDARIAGYAGLGAGHGRLRSFCLDVAASHRAGPPRRGRIELRPNAGRLDWCAVGSGQSSGELPLARGAVS